MTAALPTRADVVRQLAQIRPDTLQHLRGVRHTLLLVGRLDAPGVYKADLAEVRRQGLHTAKVAHQAERELAAILAA